MRWRSTGCSVPGPSSSARPMSRLCSPIRKAINRSLTPGGSSGGASAALAAGLTALEIGSDIGGSIRNPAHYCGVYGHKPSYGIAPPRGQALPGNVAASDISVIGPLGRSAADIALALDIIAGP